MQIDRVKTAAYYEALQVDVCDCTYCRNFYEALNETELGALLQQWGVHITQPRYLSHFDEAPMHRYIGEYVLIGDVPLEQTVALTFERDGEYVIAQFDVVVPWVLLPNA